MMGGMQGRLRYQAARASPGEERARRGRSAHGEAGQVCSLGRAAEWGICRVGTTRQVLAFAAISSVTSVRVSVGNS